MSRNSPDVRGPGAPEASDEQLEAFNVLVDDIWAERDELRRALLREREALAREREAIAREREEYREALAMLRDEIRRVRNEGAPDLNVDEIINENADDDDLTQVLPQGQPIVIEREDTDDEINIDTQWPPDPRSEDFLPRREPGIEEDSEFMRDRFIFGANMYEVDEDNGPFVERAMTLEASNFDYNSRAPPFIMVRMRDEYTGTDYIYEGVRYTRGNLHFLISTVTEPWRAWEMARDESVSVPSDLVVKLFRGFDTPRWYKVTHLAFYNPDSDIFEHSFNVLHQRMDPAILQRFYEMFPKEGFVYMDTDENGNLIRRQRHGRFMPYKMDFAALASSDSLVARFWKSYSGVNTLEADFQIPWFSTNPNLMEGEDSPVNSEIYSVPCFLYALKELIEPDVWDKIKNLQSIHGCGVKSSVFKEIQETLGYHKAFIVYRICHSKDEGDLYKVNYDRYPKKLKKKSQESDSWPEIKLMFWENHYMKYKDVLYNGKMQCFLRVLEDSKRNNIIVPYNAFEYAKLYDNFAYDEMLAFDDKIFIKNTPNGYSFINDVDQAVYKEKYFCKEVWFADFEATTDEEYHRPYLIVTKGVQILKGKDGVLSYEPIKIRENSCFYFWGENCQSDFLQFFLCRYGKILERKQRKPDVRIYFYNLRYDFTFILPDLKRVNKTIKGNKLYSVTGHFRAGCRDVFIDFWDALPLFQTTLKNATASYLTPIQKENIQKEIMPYSLYTFDLFDTYKDGWCPLALFLNNLPENDVRKLADVHSREHKNFMKFVRREDRMVNYKEYAIFYCEQDVNCLEKIMINFAALLFGCGLEGIRGLPPFSLNLWKYRTASSIGYDYFNRTVIFNKNEDGEMVPRFDWALPKCALRALIQKTIRGGRVMTRDNRPYHYVASSPSNFLMDYDGVSLYPSAMSLLWVTDGIPVFIKTEGEHYTKRHFKAWFTSPEEENPFKLFKDGCIHLTFLKVNRHLHFPMLCIKDPITKLNNYSNTFISVDTWVNSIDLYNLIDFQDADFTFDAAIAWKGERHYEIRDSIKNLFEFRKNNKKHPVQLVTKLMMNSIFGKSILKPTGKQKKTIDKVRYRKKEDGTWDRVDNWGEFFAANMYRIHKFQDLGDKVEVEIYKRDVSSSFNIFGSNVLAMARRIIGRVMSLAEEIEAIYGNMSPGIFYTDTDSFHIRKDLLALLETTYYDRYGKSLAGNELTQFHVDFDTPSNFEEGETVVGAVESYFIMKKVYVDKLLGSKGTIGYHMRMKGIPTDLVKFSDYEKIFNGESVTFDLLNGHTSFFYKDGHVGSRLVMTREIMTRETREKRKKENQNKRKRLNQ